MTRGYGEDFAYIHDVGHGDFARRAAPGLLRILAASGHPGGCVVDLGCGSGLWAAALRAAGYEVLGIDLSAAIVAIARARVPEATFVGCSDAAIPSAVAGQCHGSVRKMCRRWRRCPTLRPPGCLLSTW